MIKKLLNKIFKKKILPLKETLPEFEVVSNPMVPEGEAWIVDLNTGEILQKIKNIGKVK